MLLFIGQIRQYAFAMELSCERRSDGSPKYSRWEFERRFIVSPNPSLDLVAESYRKRLSDHYLLCGDLRLRELRDSDSDRIVRKLTKKYSRRDDSSQPITTIFLSETEYDALRALPGRCLTKVRHYVQVGKVIFAVDVFEGHLQGLITSEVELGSFDELAAIVPPSWARQEITADPFFRGGNLASSSREDLRNMGLVR